VTHRNGDDIGIKAQKNSGALRERDLPGGGSKKLLLRKIYAAKKGRRPREKGWGKVKRNGGISERCSEEGSRGFPKKPSEGAHMTRTLECGIQNSK